ncbi:MAG: murein DD-endopeptidase MepM/ murein hydrolase activator NlpD [Pseudohongiellaceae bacterium]|jgi:murein DD-endopeptidase MepM/ murein hydrolase activator NlpD
MKRRYKLLIGILSFIAIGFIVPERKVVPVEGATRSDWHKDSFWYEPWGSSGVHKGVDVFASRGTNVLASTNMLVLYKGTINKGGNVVVGLGPKWRIHYFAHLASIGHEAGCLVSVGRVIGTVGDTGNAKGKQPHLHYSILSLLPLPWLIDFSSQGYKKAFYLNPIRYFSGANV